jgi:hypothetical protein
LASDRVVAKAEARFEVDVHERIAGGRAAKRDFVRSPTLDGVRGEGGGGAREGSNGRRNFNNSNVTLRRSRRPNWLGAGVGETRKNGPDCLGTVVRGFQGTNPIAWKWHVMLALGAGSGLGCFIESIIWNCRFVSTGDNIRARL